MDVKKLIMVAIGALVVVAIVVVATNAYKTDDSSPAITVEPSPEATPEPMPEVTTIPTPVPAPVVEAIPGPVTSIDGPFYMHVSLNKTDGKCLVGLQLPKGAEPVDVNHLLIDIECEGEVYDNVWSLKSMDWCNADNDTLLETEEVIATVIDTSRKNVMPGKPLTIAVFREGERLQEVTVLPS